MLFIVLTRTQSIALLVVALACLAAGQAVYSIAARHANPNPRITWNPKTWENMYQLRKRFADRRWYWWCIAGNTMRSLGMLLAAVVSYIK